MDAHLKTDWREIWSSAGYNVIIPKVMLKINCILFKVNRPKWPRSHNSKIIGQINFSFLEKEFAKTV